MATEESKLVVAVDSTSVPKAKTELDAYTASAAKADAATGKLAQTSRSATSAHTAAAADMSRAEQAASAYAETEAQAAARIHDMVQASLAAADASKAQAAAQQAAAAKTAESSAAQVAASKAVTDAQTRQMAAWTASRAPVVELEALLGKTTLTTAEVAKAEALLDRAQASGVITAGELTAAFKALDEAKIKDIAVTKAQDAANKSAINSRTQYELGVLGGEIATGNTSRIKRSVPALLNASGLTTKLLSPVGLGITAVVASLALFGKAVVDREQDLLNFNKALAATGDFAGTSAAQLQGIAAMVGDSTHDYGNATKAVLALAQSGQVLGSQMQQMATIAVNVAYITGQSVESVAKQLIDLQGDPTQAVVKLTSAMGLLTSAQYNQIVITQQTKGVNAAAALAMNDLAKASDDARVKLVENAGIVIRAWDGFKNGLSDIGRMIASIGAQQTAIQKLADIQRQINNQATPGEKAALQTHFAPQIAALQQQIRSDAMFAAGQELANQGKQAHDKALAEALASTKQGDEGFVAAADQINKKRYAALVGIVDPSIRDRINAAYDQQIRDAVNRANAQYRGGSSGGVTHQSKADPLAGLSNMVAGLTARSLDVPGNATLTAYVQGVAKLVDEYDKAIAKGGNVTKATAEYDEGIKALSADLAVATAKQNAAVAAYQQAVDAQTAAQKAQLDLQVQSIGMGSREIQQAQALAQIRQQSEETIRQLTAQRNAALAINPHADTSALDAQITAEKNALQQRLANQKQYYGEVTAMQSDWANGAISAMQNWADQGADVAGQTKSLFTNAFGSMNDALATFAATGKLNFKSFVTSVLGDLARMELRIAESQILQAIISAFMPSGTGIASNYMSSGGSSYASSGVNWNVGTLQANGGAWNSPSLSELSGSILTRPTLFHGSQIPGYANGAAIAGEAGPEAVMPLTRGPNGRMGIQAYGVDGGNYNFSFTYNAANDTSASQTSGDDHRKTAKVLNDQMKAAALEVINRQRMPGGVLWRDRVAA